MAGGLVWAALGAPVKAQSPAVRPDSAEARIRYERGRRWFEQGKFSEAAAEFTEVLKVTPQAPLLHNLLGICRQQQGKSDEAAAHFEKAIALKPDFKAAHTNLGGVYLLQERFEDAAREFRATVKLDPRDAQAHLNLARAELATQQEQSGIEHLRKAYEFAPGDTAIASVLLALAEERYRRQDYTTALAMLEVIGPAMHGRAAWHEMVGYSSFKLGDPIRATAELQRALDLDPANEDYVIELAEIFLAHNNATAAITLLEAATKALAQSPRLWFALGTAHLAETHHSAAEGAFQKSLELDPRLDLVYVLLAQGHKETARWDKVQETADELIRVNPKNAAGYYYKALALMRLSADGNAADDRVEKLLRKSLDLDARDPEARYELARLLERKGETEASLRELETIVQTNPDYGPAHYQLYRIYRQRGEIAKSDAEKKAHDRINQQVRGKALKQLLVEVRERPPRDAAPGER